MDIKELVRRHKQIAEELLAEAKAYYDATGPVEVTTSFGDSTATVLLPFIPPKEFTELTDHHWPRPGNRVDAPLYFNLHAVTRNYPGIVIVADGVEDDLRRIKGDSITYLWPEMFDVMPPEDQENFRIAVWAMHIWEPQKRREAKKAREGAPATADLSGEGSLRDFIDAVTDEEREGGNG